MNTIEYVNTVYEGPTIGQLVLIAVIAGLVSGATIALLWFLGNWWAERGIDDAYDDGFEQVGEVSSTGNSSGPRLHLKADEPGWFARLREWFRSTSTEDAIDDRKVGGWTPPPRNFVGIDGELHPIDEAAQLQEQEVRDG